MTNTMNSIQENRKEKQREESRQAAGGLIVRTYEHTWQILFIRDKYGKWGFPKGHSEQTDSSLEETARREIMEETHLSDIEMIRELDTQRYDYVESDMLIHKSVQYFLFRKTGTDELTIRTEEGITAFQWVDISSSDMLSGAYENNIPLIRKAIKILSTETDRQ